MKELNTEREQLYHLFNKQSDSIVVIDCLGIITYINSNAKNLFHIPFKDIVGQPVQIIIKNYDIVQRDKEYRLFIGIKEYSEQFPITVQSQMISIENEKLNVLIINDLPDNSEKVQLKKDMKKKIEKQLQEKMKTNFVQTIQNLQNGIFIVRKDNNGEFAYVMSEGKLMDEIGYSSAALLNKALYEVFPKEIADLKQKKYEKAFEGNRVNYEIELDGKLLYVDVTPIEQENEIMEIVGTVHDFSELRTIQRELKFHQVHYQSLINYSHECIITLDKYGQIIDMNQTTKEMLGEITVVEVIAEKEKEVIDSYFQKAIQGEIQFFEFEVKHHGQRRFFNLTFLPIIIDNEIEGVYIIGKDITEQKLIQERNAYLAHHDDLTNLPNRRWMEQKISKALVTVEDNNAQKLAILYIDLDHFKSLNDTLGHYVGDELLQQIGARLQNNIDPESQFVARMGGDEFMILFPSMPSREALISIAQNLLQSFQKPFYVQSYELLITASIGIVACSSCRSDVTELMKKADIALYKAKEIGRNMYQIYDDSMSKKSSQTFFLERDLRKAILKDEFMAYFQPRVDALTGKTVSAEALIRWNHPELGLVPPGSFIPLAEETGFIISIGQWMKRKVCEQLVAWREADIPIVPISVNISSKRFLQMNFAKDIRELLEEYQLEGKWLEIEITENSIMRNEETVQKTLRELKEMGVKIYIDDFGTGYSSFNYLKTFNLDGVKIDRSFIQNISTNSENAGITTAMIKMAQYLKLDVIAEGVETKEELDYLLEHNCHYIQGYYYGKPCPTEEFKQSFLM